MDKTGMTVAENAPKGRIRQRRRTATSIIANQAALDDCRGLARLGRFFDVNPSMRFCTPEIHGHQHSDYDEQ
jgi:hypothetical protein